MESETQARAEMMGTGQMVMAVTLIAILSLPTLVLVDLLQQLMSELFLAGITETVLQQMRFWSDTIRMTTMEMGETTLERWKQDGTDPGTVAPQNQSALMNVEMVRSSQPWQPPTEMMGTLTLGMGAVPLALRKQAIHAHQVESEWPVFVQKHEETQK